MRTAQRSTFLSLLIFLCGSAAMAGVLAPVAVSPGATDSIPVVATPCPTFSWGATEASRGYELVVYSVPEETNGRNGPPLFRVRVPGAASSWTPSLDLCLEAGKRYAWSVRALGKRGGSDWSEAAVFKVRVAPSAAEVEWALELLRRYAASQTVDAARGQEALQPGEPKPTQRQGMELTVPRGAAPTMSAASLTVDEQIHLGSASQIFKEGEPFLWDDATNLALGRGALSSNMEGEGNTALGLLALEQNTTGGDNIALGKSAGGQVTTGSSNIHIGNEGEAGDTATIRIGGQAIQERIFVSGISGVPLLGNLVVVDEYGQLGVGQELWVDEVGVSTASLHLTAGSLELSGADSGVVFPDGSKQTTAWQQASLALTCTTRTGGATVSCQPEEVMTAASCYGEDICSSGDDWSGYGGRLSDNGISCATWDCTDVSAYVRCCRFDIEHCGTEVPGPLCSDGVDNDCDALVDDLDLDCCPESINTYYRDADGDGYGDPSNTVRTCSESAPVGFVLNDLDCDDSDPGVNPDAIDCAGDGDEDCDGLIDNDRCEWECVGFPEVNCDPACNPFWACDCRCNPHCQCDLRCPLVDPCDPACPPAPWCP